MTVACEHRLAGHLELDGAAETSGPVRGGGCSCLFAIGQQIIVIRMFRHEVPDEIAFDMEFAALRPHGVKGRASQLRTYAPSAQFRRHLGVYQRDRIR
jgi:hypothetical protein